MLQILEISATIFGLVQGILIWLNKKENWIFYILNISTLIAFSFISKLYGDVLENLIYLVIGIIGTTIWYNKNIGNKVFSTSYCTMLERLKFSLISIAIMVICYIWLIYTDDPMPMLDAITTGLGIMATIMMAIKKVEAWIVWLVDDILMAVIYFNLPDQAVYLGMLNIVWILLAILSFVNWHMESERNKDEIKGT